VPWDVFADPVAADSGSRKNFRTSWWPWRICCATTPLVSYDVILHFIRRTRSATGFHCKARLDTTPYATGQKVSKEERRAVRLKRRPVLSRWNYTIFPRP
jgi:hypothetical protein